MNNHVAVWGSYYDMSSGLWGYACCHSVIHVSYCSGQAGIEAAKASSAQNLLSAAAREASDEPMEEVAEPIHDADDRRRQAQQAYSKERLGEGEFKLNDTRLADALREEKKRKGRGEDTGDRTGKRKKGDDSHDVSEEQLGMLSSCCRVFCDAYTPSRGIPDEPKQSGGSDGQLRGRGSVIIVYVTCLIYFVPTSVRSRHLVAPSGPSLIF